MAKIITDEEWERFLAYWKNRWLDSPNRNGIECFLKWREDK